MAQFQSTPSRGGRHLYVFSLICLIGFQSTPSRGGRHICVVKFKTTIMFQSTPSRGGRRSLRSFRFRLLSVSIHALTRRATNLSVSSVHHDVMFQSTPSRGGRHTVMHSRLTVISFNPRPHAEGDLSALLRLKVWPKFQSTPSRGGRQTAGVGNLLPVGFQSTPSRGGRPLPLVRITKRDFVSIHALTRRAT